MSSNEDSSSAADVGGVRELEASSPTTVGAHGRNYSMLLTEVVNSDGNVAPTLRLVVAFLLLLLLLLLLVLFLSCYLFAFCAQSKFATDTQRHGLNMQTQRHRDTHTDTHRETYTHTHTQTHTHTRARAHTHTQTHRHTYTHTHTSLPGCETHINLPFFFLLYWSYQGLCTTLRAQTCLRSSGHWKSKRPRWMATLSACAAHTTKDSSIPSIGCSS